MVFLIIPKKKSKFKAQVLFMEQLPEEGAGFNYRVKKWAELFNAHNMTTETMSLVVKSEDFFRMTQAENLPKFILQSGFKRFRQIIQSRKYETVIVRRSVLIYNDYGNLFMEKLLRTVHPNIILDFDDDISTNRNLSQKKSKFEKLLLDNSNRFKESFKYYDRFIAGSNYLKQFVLQNTTKVHEQNICVIPTCVDYTELKQKQYTIEQEKTIFGWIGGNHNLPLLDSIIPALNQLSKEFPIELHVISGVKEYNFEAVFPIKFIAYNLETEKEHLRNIEIGLMPLFNDPVSKGKCGFKLIQYMGLGIPSVASNVTVNSEIIDDNYNGWLVDPNENWFETLKLVCLNKKNFESFGLKARLKIDQSYSFKSQLSKYMSFILNHRETNV